MRKIYLLLVLSAPAFFANAQPDLKTQEKLKVFIDCSSTWCDMNFIRTEINLVDFLLDRVAADVHVLVTQQNTGSGGNRYQLIFFGQHSFKNTRDTIRFDTGPNATDFERRDALIKYIKLGIAPLVAKTGAGKDASISLKREETKANKDSAVQTRDPWNYWVFNIGVNGNLSQDENYKNSSLSLNVSASRITDKLKTGFSGYGSKNKTVFNIDNGNGTIDKINVDNEFYNFDYFLIASLSNHWSYGYKASFERNSFSNNKSRIKLETGFEYSIFPYKDVNTKYMTLSYRVDARRNEYFDTTLYDKTLEILYGQSAEMNIIFNQKWGTIRFGAEYHNYFHNWKFYSLAGNCELNIRITGGLSFNVYSYAELTRDQIFLPKGGATPQEVLTRRRQLASGYNFYTYFGINYRFGSKLNNFVNPRFD